MPVCVVGWTSGLYGVLCVTAAGWCVSTFQRKLVSLSVDWKNTPFEVAADLFNVSSKLTPVFLINFCAATWTRSDVAWPLIATICSPIFMPDWDPLPPPVTRLNRNSSDQTHGQMGFGRVEGVWVVTLWALPLTLCWVELKSLCHLEFEYPTGHHLWASPCTNYPFFLGFS